MNTIRGTGYRNEVARLTPNLRRFARALVRDHDAEAADELVQVTLVRAMAEAESRQGIRLLVWLLSTLTSLHRAQLRHASSEKVHSTASVRSGSGSSPGSWNGASSVRSRDQALLSSIPLDCREVLLLVTLEGLSYAQVADSLGITQAAVVSRLAQARRQLALSQPSVAATLLCEPTEAPRRPKVAAPYLRVVK